MRKLKSTRRAHRWLALSLPLVAAFAPVAKADISATWTADSNGSWGSSTKWSTAPNSPRNGHPNAGSDYTATINATGTNNYTVTLDDTPITIDGLNIDSAQATFLQNTGAFSPGIVNVIAGTYMLDGTGSSINAASINVEPAGKMELLAGILNGGSVTANGAGSLVTIGSGLSETGSPTIQAVNGGKVELQNGNFVNNSAMPTGAANGIVSIGGGAILDNTGVTAGSSSTVLSGTGATLQLNGGTIRGGTISSTGGTFFNNSTGTLDGTPASGITLVGSLQENYGSTTYLQGLINDPDGFTFDASQTNYYDYSVVLAGNTELSGVGTTTTLTAPDQYNTVSFGGLTGNEQLTIDSGHTLLSQASVESYGALTLINSGTVQADGANSIFNLTLNTGANINNGSVKATNGAYLVLDGANGGTFANNGVIQADGINSEVYLATGNGSSSSDAVKATNGGLVVLDNSAGGAFANSGTIQADGGASEVYIALSASGGSNTSTIEATNGGTLVVDNSPGGTFTNSGTIMSNGSGSSLVVRGNGFTNTGPGTIEAINDATLELQAGNFVNNSAVLNVTAGGTFSVGNGATFDNTGMTAGSGNTLQPPPGGTLQLNGGTISGGTVSNTSGTFYNASSGTLDGTPAGGITVLGTLLHANAATTYLQGLINDPSGFTFDVAPSAGYYNIDLSGDTELSGNGTTTTLANSQGGGVFLGVIASLPVVPQLTIDAGHTLFCQANVSGGGFALNNDGIIQAGSNGLNLDCAGGTNAGIIEATNGALVVLQGTLANSGTIEANGAANTLVLEAGFGYSGIVCSGSGSIQVTNGATLAYEEGIFANSGLVTSGAGTTVAVFDATIDNTGTVPGSSSTLQAPAGGTIGLSGGTISGGTLSSVGGTIVNEGSSSSSELDGSPAGGITLIGTILQANGAGMFLRGLIIDPDGFTFESAPSAGAGASYELAVLGSAELSGNNTTTTLANSNGGVVNIGSDREGEILTVDNGHTLLSKADVQAAGIALNNNGTVQADGANNQFYLALYGASSNTGMIAATNGAVVTLDDSAGGTFANSGILEASGGGAITFVSANLTNTGTIELHNGTINTDVALAVGDGTLDGSGTINGDVTLSSDPSILAFEILGASDFDSLTIHGNLSLAGCLQITLAPGAVSLLDSDQTFDVLSASSLTGSFLNVTDDERLITADGGGSFLVNYGTGADSDEIVLSDFQTVPEPATVSLLMLGCAGLLARRRLACQK